jgi:rfaE bifunctional protein nucleotidyltransferase chain/domain
MNEPTTAPVFTFQELLAYRKACAGQNQRFVLTNGCFDILHEGHLSYLMQSAALGDVLAIAVNSDQSVRALKGPDRPVNSQHARAFALSCLRFVDAVFIFPGPRLADEILALRPDVYTKAGDYTLDSLDPSERDSLLATGAEIHILPLVQNISTTKIIEAIRSHP